MNRPRSVSLARGILCCILLVALVGVVIGCPARALAQAQTKPTPLPSPPSRRTKEVQELIAKHRADLNQMIEEEKRKQAEAALAGRREEMRRLLDEKRKLGQTPPGERYRPDGQATTASAGAGATTPSLSPPTPVSLTAAPPVILMLTPLNQIVPVGGRFGTTVTLVTQEPHSFDAIRLRVSYPDQFVRPVKVFDYDIANALGKSPARRYGWNGGVLQYDAKLAEPMIASGETPVLHIIWEAVSPTVGGELDLGRDPETASAVLSGDNILTRSEMFPDCAGINAVVQVTPENRGKTSERRLPEAAPAGARTELGPAASQGNGVSLRLLRPKLATVAGDTFILDLMLDNPKRSPVQEVQAFISFDTTRVRVMDWDRRGWIRDGINLQDAYAHKDYPFDIQRANRADNATGRITYHMGFTTARRVPSVSIARIRCRALSDGADSAVRLTDEGAAVPTAAQTAPVRSDALTSPTDAPPTTSDAPPSDTP